MDFYVILGLDRGASTGDVKRAYRRLARKYHPDINPGDRTAEALFRRIVEAYETLSDPDRRRRYDALGEPEPGAVSASLEFEGFDFSLVAEGAGAATFGELFSDVLRRPRGAATEARGADLHASLPVSFDEAMAGVERAVTVTRLEPCALCGGSGRLRTSEGRCRHCHGAGSLRWARGHMIFTKACAACGGTGRQRHQGCQGCAAEGVTPRSEAVRVRVPAGIADGDRIRVPEKGHASRGGARGHLYVTVQVAPHPIFVRDRDDIHVVVPIAVHEAVLGAKIEVPAVGGPVRLRVPPGTQSGQRFRLRGRGAPGDGGRRGDLVVEARLVLPRVVDERSKELMREFGRLNGENVRRHLGADRPGGAGER